MSSVASSALLVFVLGLGATVAAQQPLTPAHAFKDGIYLSFEDFRNDRPSILPGAYVFSETEHANFCQRVLFDFQIGADYEVERPRQIWGICIDGIPYINQSRFLLNLGPETAVGDGLLTTRHGTTFTRISMIGHLCLLTLEATPAHTPLLGVKRVVAEKKLLKLTTGEVVDFESDDLAGLIRDDAELHRQFVHDRRKKDKLFEYYLVYNQRNPVYLKNL